MRSPEGFQLTFFLSPRHARRAGPAGVHRPQLDGEGFLEIRRFADDSAMVQVGGPSKEAVFERARRFLRVTIKDAGPCKIEAVLRTADRCLEAVGGTGARRTIGRRGFDPIMILIDVEIAFAFTAMPVNIGRERIVNHEPGEPSQAGAGR